MKQDDDSPPNNVDNLPHQKKKKLITRGMTMTERDRERDIKSAIFDVFQHVFVAELISIILISVTTWHGNSCL